MSEKTENPLGTEKINKLIARFAIPSIISMLVSSLYNIVDQIFIGQGVGMLGNAATNISFPVTTICVAAALLMGIGSASNFNLRSGEGKIDEAKSIAGTGLSMLVLVGIFFMIVLLVFLKPLMYVFGASDEVLPYAMDYTRIIAIGVPFSIVTTGGCHLVRADRRPTFSMVSMLSGAIVNTILDPVFIFACKWGIKGAAWATVLGQTLSGVMILVYFAKMSNMKLRKDQLIPRMSNLKKIIALGIASGVNQIAITCMQIVLNNVLKKYGAQSVYGAEIPLACAGIISKVNQVFMSICIGVSQGCQPIFGFNFGAKNYRRVKETYRTALIITLAVGCCFFACFQLFPRAIISMFGSGTEEYYAFAVMYFRIFMFLTFVNGIQPFSSNFFTSIGKAQLGLTVSLTRQFLFFIPLVLIFPIFFGIDGVLYVGPIADGAAFLITILFVIREMKRIRQLEKSETDNKLT